MDLATAETVLADFNQVSLEHLGVRTVMSKRDERFFVSTEGEDGKEHEFEVKYVFGFDPLQQYMVEFPNPSMNSGNEVGRVQVLRWSWDTENKKWYHLDPPDVKDRIKTDDPLHWTGSAQRWNTMCAECHSTNLVKGFDAKTNSFHTTFSEIDVSCEACHGPASIHLKLVGNWGMRRDPVYGTGLAPLKQSSENQIQACASCHARRSLIAGGFQAGDNYYDHFAESLLTQGIYFADGQVQDEDYIHGSFLQSKMYHKGIKCTDCHDPHTSKLKHNGNQVCNSCHQHPAAKYDSVAHHFHKLGSPGSQCVNCHMPSTTYMETDPRRDHSLRIPRPDLSLRLGTPNACTGCHIDIKKLPEEYSSAEPKVKLKQYLDWMNAAIGGDEIVAQELKRIDRWCDQACDKWYGDKRYREDHFATPITSVRENRSDALKVAQTWLGRTGPVAPAIARATLLEELARQGTEGATRLAKAHLEDEHPLVRRAALSLVAQEPDIAKRVLLARPLLEDPILSVRVEAARILATTGPEAWSILKVAEQVAANRIWIESLQANSDSMGSHMALGSFDELLRKTESAIGHYEDAMRIEPHATGPRTNLAALLESLAGNDPGAEKLRERAKRLRFEELPLLKRDADLLPKSADLQHRYGLALYLAGDFNEAVARLKIAYELAPQRTDLGMAYVLLLQKLDRNTEARDVIQQLLRIDPQDQQLLQIQQSLR